MIFSYYNQSILNQTNIIHPTELIIVLILAISSIIVIYKLINFKEIDTEEQIYFLLIFFGFFILYIAFSKIINNVEYGLGFSLILISEAFFWYSLRFVLAREKVREHDLAISYINTSLVGLVYLIFIFFLVLLNNFRIDETNIYILTTLLLISIFKNIYGIVTNPNEINFFQLHIYSYIFLFFSIVLSIDSTVKPFFYSLMSYLIGLYSANEISNMTNSKFNINIFKFWLFILFIGAFILMLSTSKITPMLPLGFIGLVIAWTLIKIKQKSFDEEIQSYMLFGIIIFALILYYITTGKIFLIDQLIEIVK